MALESCPYGQQITYKSFCSGLGRRVKVRNHSEHRIVRWDRLDELGDNDYWLRFANRDYRPRMCDGCMRQGICDGGCREAAHLCGGDISSPDPCLAQ